jgi:hypothetical protein
MAGWNHDNANWKPKNCAVCDKEFTPKSGVHKFCSEQCKGKWQYITGRASTKNQYKKISGNWRRYLSRLQYAAGRKRDKLSVDTLLEKLEEQDYKCALSGLPLTCHLEKGKKFPHNVSVDRVIPGGPYTKENIQLVCRALNSWRADTDMDEFVEMCRAVAKHFDKRESEV